MRIAAHLMRDAHVQGLGLLLPHLHTHVHVHLRTRKRERTETHLGAAYTKRVAETRPHLHAVTRRVWQRGRRRGRRGWAGSTLMGARRTPRLEARIPPAHGDRVRDGDFIPTMIRICI